MKPAIKELIDEWKKKKYGSILSSIYTYNHIHCIFNFNSYSMMNLLATGNMSSNKNDPSNNLNLVSIFHIFTLY